MSKKRRRKGKSPRRTRLQKTNRVRFGNATDDLFLETTSLIAYCAGRKSEKRDDYAVLSRIYRRHAGDKCTSSFVLFELYAGYLNHLANFRNMLSVANDLSEFNRFFQRGNLQRRANERETLRAIKDWLEEQFFEDDSVELPEYRCFRLEALRHQYERIWKKARRLAKPLRLRCHPDLNEVSGRPNASGLLPMYKDLPNCRDALYACGVSELCTSKTWRHVLKGVDKHLNRDKTDKQLQSRKKKLQELESASEYEKMNHSRCRTIGDAFVAVDCPEGYTLVTKNDRHFDQMCHRLKICMLSFDEFIELEKAQ